MDRSFSGGANKRPPDRDTPQPKTNNASNFKPRQPLACFLCQGPHRVAECQYRGALNALVASSQEGGHSQQSVKKVENEPARMGSIRFFNALHTQLSQLKKEPERGLMYVEVMLNGKTTRVMVDTGATDTFISPEKAKRYDLKVTKDCRQMKVVNSPASAISGSSKNVITKLGPWE